MILPRFGCCFYGQRCRPINLQDTFYTVYSSMKSSYRKAAGICIYDIHNTNRDFCCKYIFGHSQSCYQLKSRIAEHFIIRAYPFESFIESKRNFLKQIHATHIGNLSVYDCIGPVLHYLGCQLLCRI